MPRLSPQLKAGIHRFRSQRRAYWSLLSLILLFLVCLPAELLCNSRPLVVRYDGRWYFPAFRSYTEADFGGAQTIPPDYRSARFLELVGHEAEPSFSETAPSSLPGEDSSSDILDLFDDEESPGNAAAEAVGLGDFDLEDGEAPGEHQEALQAETRRYAPGLYDILNDFDPEPWDVDLDVPEAKQTGKAAEPAWILWPPVRYDYAYISRSSVSGRDALASPWGQVIPGSGKTYGSSWEDGHWLGTDDRGRDVLARLVYGVRVSMIFGLLLALSGALIGCCLGAIQGFFGGLTDLLGQRFTEIWGSLPQLYLLMILSSFLARNIYVLFFILNLTSWMGMAAYMRAEFLRGRQLDYVMAARGLGASSRSIMFRHILPNSLTPIITFLPFNISGGILALVSLDFLNLGVPSPYPSLGELLGQGQANLQATWIIVPTFIVLSGTVTLLTFVGDGLRNAFDPRKTV